LAPIAFSSPVRCCAATACAAFLQVLEIEQLCPSGRNSSFDQLRPSQVEVCHEELSKVLESFSKSRRGMIGTAQLTHLQMLKLIGGGEGVKMPAMDHAIRKRLNWWTKARSAVRHILHGEQKLTSQDERDIELGYLKYCADLIEAHRHEDEQHLATIRSSLEYLQSVDPDFHRPAIEALGQLADRLRNIAVKTGTGD
jgi:hypothetical protein